MWRKLKYNFLIGVDALVQNRLRAMLTSLGIIFGVASVIAMLAIGKGAEKEILTQMELLGANNVIIKPLIEQEEGMISGSESVDEESEEEDEDSGGIGVPRKNSRKFTPGLSLSDASSLGQIPMVNFASPELVLETNVMRKGYKRSSKLVGVRNNYFSGENLQLKDGNFFDEDHHKYAQAVCIIGGAVKSRFFPTEKAVGKSIKCGSLWLKVIGVLDARFVSAKNRSEFGRLGIRNFDFDIYVPLRTALMRYENRALLTIQDIQDANSPHAEAEIGNGNYHQVDKIVLQVTDSRYARNVAEIAQRMLNRRHNEVIDFEVIVPEELLEQKQQTTRIFNFVLGAIASISLLVGGIGIMNIMLASVLERIKEIGLRMSIGATQKDIIYQFMSEAIAISITGGMLGILLGIGFSYLIRQAAAIETVVSPGSIVLSFFVALAIGLVFGIYPARKAAMQDPVVSLRAS